MNNWREYAAVAAIREAVSTARETGRAKDIPESLARLAYAEAQLGRYRQVLRKVEAAALEVVESREFIHRLVREC